HTPVLLHDCIEGLAIQPAGDYVDVTFGGGGHSRVMLEQLTSGRLFAFDQDADAEENLIADTRFHFIRQNFQFLKNNLRLKGVRQVDGILADLGVSSHQFDEAERGFSTRFDAELDMRMDRDSSLTARGVLETYSKEELVRVFRQGTDIKHIPGLADAIINARPTGVSTTEELKAAIAHRTPDRKRAQFLAQVFQAVRIEVNGELDVLARMLEQAIDILKPGGRLVVISYHSIEDRLVKHFVKAGNAEGELVKDFYGVPTVPLKRNPRRRSAKLRIAEKAMKPASKKKD
ncbi:UNVERIFIED_CONTAM: hypothetical protein GTU68_061935, partial [Idotea baltica]|nr:hypothetical protein [Idotea baltica]